MRYYLIDAFTDRAFAGNPAAVCLLENPIPDELMASIAREMNLSETAFVLREGDAWHLRWFTPAVEVPLCGHGTLATARALREEGLVSGRDVRFRSLSGDLAAHYREDWIELDFPSLPPVPAPLPDNFLEALNIDIMPRWTGVNTHRYWLIDMGAAALVRTLSPDRTATMALKVPGIIVTGPISENMRLATLKTWAAVPAPKLVIAVGACAISGGAFRDHPEQHNGIGTFLPVDLFVPGCPPHPYTILDGLLRLLGRV